MKSVQKSQWETPIWPCRSHTFRTAAWLKTVGCLEQWKPLVSDQTWTLVLISKVWEHLRKHSINQWEIFRILKWTGPYKATFCGHITFFRPYIGLTYGRYLPFRFLKLPCNKWEIIYYYPQVWANYIQLCQLHRCIFLLFCFGLKIHQNCLTCQFQYRTMKPIGTEASWEFWDFELVGCKW